MTTHQSDSWRIVCPASVFPVIKDDDKFWQLVTLARLANALRFTKVAPESVQDSDTPLAMRHRLNSFFYAAALLFEGMPLVQRLARHYRTNRSFQEGFAPILSDRSVKDLLSKNLGPLRNFAAFHFSERDLGSSISDREFSEFVFASGTGKAADQVYYELADVLAIRLLVGKCDSIDEFFERYKDLLCRTANLTARFLASADKLIAEVLPTMGFRMTG